MKKFISIIILTMTLSCFSQTQTEINNSANSEYEKADRELNNIYQEILTEYRTDSIFIEKLKKAQRIWISYRDAELEMRFPATKKQLEYGSVYPMCASIYLKELTKERIKKLKLWLNKKSEIDVCSGSIKPN